MRDIVKHELNSNTMYMGAAMYPKSARSWKQVHMPVYCVKYYIVLWNCNSHFVSSITSSIKSSKQMAFTILRSRSRGLMG